jgi:hypothetical protein
MRDGCGEGDGGSARKTWYRQSHDDDCRAKSAMAGRPQRDAVAGDAGRSWTRVVGAGVNPEMPRRFAA